MTQFKRPVSVLVVIHTRERQILLLERALHPGYWQSVTGSQEGNERLIETAQREVEEETGIRAELERFSDWQISNRYEILSLWRHRYAPGITHNTEHVFSLEIPSTQPIRIARNEHRAFLWADWREAADKCFSWSNRDAILMLDEKLAH